VTNVTFSFETSPNTKPTRKSGGHVILCPPSLKKWSPHQIEPMLGMGRWKILSLPWWWWT